MLNTGLLQRESVTALLVLKFNHFVEKVKLLKLVLLYLELYLNYFHCFPLHFLGSVFEQTDHEMLYRA